MHLSATERQVQNPPVIRYLTDDVKRKVLVEMRAMEVSMAEKLVAAGVFAIAFAIASVILLGSVRIFLLD